MIFTIPKEAYAALPPLVLELFPTNRFSFTNLLSTQTKKMRHSPDQGYLSVGFYMAPNNTVGLFNVCGAESEWCAASCLGKGKRYGLTRGHRALVARALFWHFCPELFRTELWYEMDLSHRRAKRAGLPLAVRLNGTSDIPWESHGGGYVLPALMSLYPEAHFYDYTKHAARCFADYKKRHEVERYHLTFSFSGENEQQCRKLLSLGKNVAAVFARDTWSLSSRKEPLPKEHWGYPVIDGDEHDCRWLDPQPCIVGLRQKRAYRVPGHNGWVNAEESGPFVVRGAA